MKPVIITTRHRGVFFGHVPEDQDMFAENITVEDSLMVICWGTKKGLAQLAHTGPTPDSRLSAPVAKWHIRDITSVLDVSADAAQGFKDAVS